MENKSRGNISSLNETNETLILDSTKTRVPTVIVNINGKSFIDIKESKNLPKKEDSQKINLKSRPEPG